ncbi:MAG: hypothetical protein ACRDZX_00100, partial [Acidimicrobiales bacterium]
MATTPSPRTTTSQRSASHDRAPNDKARPDRSRPVPLAVWPVAQRSAQYQRAGRYHPACTAHPAKKLPDLARRIVAEYSEPGAL